MNEFNIDVPEEALDDLRRRVEETRWPDKETVTDRSQGRSEQHSDRCANRNIRQVRSAEGWNVSCHKFACAIASNGAIWNDDSDFGEQNLVETYSSSDVINSFDTL